jgi:hypothetical protein
MDPSPQDGLEELNNTKTKIKIKIKIEIKSKIKIYQMCHLAT